MFLKEFCRDSRGICKGTLLESVYTVKGIVDSNPTLSAKDAGSRALSKPT